MRPAVHRVPGNLHPTVQTSGVTGQASVVVQTRHTEAALDTAATTRAFKASWKRSQQKVGFQTLAGDCQPWRDRKLAIMWHIT
jgi:hypothetical protein